MSDIDDSQLREIVAEFVAESREHVDGFERSLLTLEREPDDPEATSEAFRAMHSIKGNASFLALGPFEAVTHMGETVLGQIRDRELDVARPVIDALLGLADVLRRLLDQLERGQSLEAIGVHEQLAALERSLVEGSEAELLAPEPGLADGEAGAGDRDDGDGDGDAASAKAGAAKIRVDVALLDRLMNLVGELVLARNQILQHAGERELQTAQLATQRLDQVTSQLQDAVMKTRMQPVGSAWTRFPRVVRDVCQELGKQARVRMSGRETELDKRIIEALNDPLTHLLRNAVDHGVERPAQRLAAGKPAQATIWVRGFHEGGLVNIEISDDGPGVDLDAVRERALALGHRIDAEASERELLALLFEPGFSTRAEVTSLSGRGVGLDVVRTNIERLGGSIDLHSRRGEGTTVRIKIPLTLAIIPALIVTTVGERFALPQANLLEIVRVDTRRTTSGPRLDEVHGAPVLSLRGQLLPLADLAAELRLRGPTRTRTSPGPGAGEGEDEGEGVSVVILQAEERRYGLLVDEVHDTEEIVVKPMWAALAGLGCYAGATVLGDGRVALILDALGLAAHARLLGEDELAARSRQAQLAGAEAGSEHGEGRLVLLCRGERGEQLAIEVAKVARLEELPRAAVERSGPNHVIQHNGEIVPLVDLGAVFDDRGRAPAPIDAAIRGEAMQVILHRLDGRLAGLVVAELLDIVEVEVELQRPASRAGIRGSMIIEGRVTDFVDVEAVIRAGVQGFAGSALGGREVQA